MTSPQNATNSVVVVGGGFGGLFSALAIRERLPERPVVVLEPHSNFVFNPTCMNSSAVKCRAGKWHRVIETC